MWGGARKRTTQSEAQTGLQSGNHSSRTRLPTSAAPGCEEREGEDLPPTSDVPPPPAFKSKTRRWISHGGRLTWSRKSGNLCTRSGRVNSCNISLFPHDSRCMHEATATKRTPQIRRLALRDAARSHTFPRIIKNSTLIHTQAKHNTHKYSTKHDTHVRAFFIVSRNGGITNLSPKSRA